MAKVQETNWHKKGRGLRRGGGGRGAEKGGEGGRGRGREGGRGEGG